MNEPRPDPAQEPTPREIRLAAVLGLSRYLRAQRATDLRELGVAIESLGECARRALATADLRACSRLELAANLVRLVLREGVAAEECETLEEHARQLLAGIQARAQAEGIGLEKAELADRKLGPFEIVLEKDPADEFKKGEPAFVDRDGRARPLPRREVTE